MYQSIKILHLVKVTLDHCGHENACINHLQSGHFVINQNTIKNQLYSAGF